MGERQRRTTRVAGHHKDVGADALDRRFDAGLYALQHSE